MASFSGSESQLGFIVGYERSIVVVVAWLEVAWSDGTMARKILEHLYSFPRQHFSCSFSGEGGCCSGGSQLICVGCTPSSMPLVLEVAGDPSLVRGFSPSLFFLAEIP